MQSPPPYSASGKKKSSVGLIIAIVVGCLALCCIVPTFVIGKLGMDAFKGSTQMLVCGTDMAAVRDAMTGYSKKHNGTLPAAVNWRKDIEPFLKTPVIPPPFKSPGISTGICDEPSQTVIAYNTDVAGKKRDALEDKEDAVVLFETKGTGSNLSKKYSVQPEEDSPKIMGNKSRGWVQVGMSGDAYLIDKRGRHVTIGKISQGSKGSVNVSSDN